MHLPIIMVRVSFNGKWKLTRMSGDIDEVLKTIGRSKTEVFGYRRADEVQWVSQFAIGEKHLLLRTNYLNVQKGLPISVREIEYETVERLDGKVTGDDGSQNKGFTDPQVSSNWISDQSYITQWEFTVNKRRVELKVTRTLVSPTQTLVVMEARPKQGEKWYRMERHFIRIDQLQQGDNDKFTTHRSKFPNHVYHG
jgi:hypothetical protein